MKEIEIFTDGACSATPGLAAGARCCAIAARKRALGRRGRNHQQPHGAHRLPPRPGRAERTLPDHPVQRFQICDRRPAKGWAKGWRARGWKKADKSPALNPDPVGPALELAEPHTITYKWIKGHAGHPENERCDRLAVAQSKKIRRKAGIIPQIKKPSGRRSISAAEGSLRSKTAQPSNTRSNAGLSAGAALCSITNPR